MYNVSVSMREIGNWRQFSSELRQKRKKHLWLNLQCIEIVRMMRFIVLLCVVFCLPKIKSVFTNFFLYDVFDVYALITFYSANQPKDNLINDNYSAFNFVI